jgi:hypothetical protein
MKRETTIPTGLTFGERAEILQNRANELRHEADRLARRVADAAAQPETGPPSDGLVNRYARVRQLAVRCERRSDELFNKGMAFDAETNVAQSVGDSLAVETANNTSTEEPLPMWSQLDDDIERLYRRRLSAELGGRSIDSIEAMQLRRSYNAEARRINEVERRDYKAGEFAV